MVAGLLKWRRSPKAVFVAAVVLAVTSAALMEVLFAAGILSNYPPAAPLLLRPVLPCRMSADDFSGSWT